MELSNKESHKTIDQKTQYPEKLPGLIREMLSLPSHKNKTCKKA
jgi:hypothetical protein